LNSSFVIASGLSLKIGSGLTLSDILQKEVGEEYFLSSKAISGLLKGQQKPQLLQSQQEDIQEDIIRE
jgi:hypothetical protein